MNAEYADFKGLFRVHLRSSASHIKFGVNDVYLLLALVFHNLAIFHHQRDVIHIL